MPKKSIFDDSPPTTMVEKFIDWMKFNPPYAASMKEWGEFKERYQTEAPIRYFLVETVPDFFRPVKWKLEKARSWLRFRIVRYHIVDTGLKPDYYETEELMLHANFNLLKNFVEVQKGWMYAITHDEVELNWKEKYIPYYRRITFSRPDLGLKYLEWETTLDSEDREPFERNPHQAERAREVLELYRWWTETRPAREDITQPDYDDQGLYGSILNEDFDKSSPDWTAADRAFRYQEQLEEDWVKEDTEMLIRLIKVRKELWT